MIDLKEYVKQTGMRIVLEELIDLCDENLISLFNDEAHIKVLKTDLEQTLINYMNRYDS